MIEKVRFIFQDLPPSVRGFTVQFDDFYTVILNSKLSHAQNTDTARHELKHIADEHFSSESDVQELETLTHEAIQVH